MGLAISVASTVVLIRGLMDNGLLNTSHGQAAVGWLVFEDLATILILILMPGMVGKAEGIDWVTPCSGLGKRVLLLASDNKIAISGPPGSTILLIE